MVLKGIRMCITRGCYGFGWLTAGFVFVLLRYRFLGVDMSYFKGGCGVRRWRAIGVGRGPERRNGASGDFHGLQGRQRCIVPKGSYGRIVRGQRRSAPAMSFSSSKSPTTTTSAFVDSNILVAGGPHPRGVRRPRQRISRWHQRAHEGREAGSWLAVLVEGGRKGRPEYA